MGLIRPLLDENGNIKAPTIVLCNRNKHKLGAIYPIQDFEITPDIHNVNECSFKVYKEVNGIETPLWDKIQDLKIIYMPEYDEWFQIAIDKDCSSSTVKSIVAENLGVAELSQTILYDIEINTEDDIARDDYEIAKLYNPDSPKNSLLGRVLSKAPHYKIKHVDSTIMNMVRSFSINDTSIYDFLNNELSEELDCIAIVGSDRTISLYDLEDSCDDCGYRSDNIQYVCPKCSSKNIIHGYGESTPVYISLDNLAESVSVQSNSDKVKNTLRVQGGDDVINAAVRAVNPNGTEYINRFANFQTEDMSDELVAKINSYQSLYDSKISDYRIVMTNIYNAIDQILYLTSEMMPTPSTEETNSNKELAKLTAVNIGTIAVQNLRIAGLVTVNNAVKSIASIYMSPGYEVEIASSTYSKGLWSGKFVVTNVGDTNDTATNKSDIKLVVNDDYETFVFQKLEKTLYKEDVDSFSTYDWTKYCLNRLSSFSDAYQTCLDILIEMGIGNSNHEFYSSIYLSYYNMKMAIDKEIAVRESQIKIQENKQETNEKNRDDIQDQLDFEKYLGAVLYEEYCAYRREDTYQNDNYISDGLSNTEIFEKANELVEVATKELYKSSELQYSITTEIGNLFAIKELESFRDKFVPGNWIRISDDDNIYKLRLLDYTISDSDDISKLSCNFSTTTKIEEGISDVKSILEQAKSMATSYQSVKRQAKKGNSASNDIKTWVDKGLDATTVEINNTEDQEVTMDNHGLLCRSYDDITETYSDEQLKITSNILGITDDNWKTVKTAIGKIHYADPENPNNMLSAYGVLAETLVGKLILGEALGIYNNGGSLQFTENGLIISNGDTVFTVNPNANNLFCIRKGSTNVLYVDKNGNGVFNGKVYATDGEFSGKVIADSGKIGNWNITQTSISQSHTSANGDTYYISFQNENNDLPESQVLTCVKNGATTFYLCRNGKMFCNDADIIGRIRATSGTIAGWNIGDDAIYKDYGNYRAYIQTPSSEDKWIFSTQTKNNSGGYNATYFVKQDGSAYFGNNLTINGKLTIGADTIFTNTKSWIYVGSDKKRWLPRTYGTEAINDSNFYGIEDIYGRYDNSTGKMYLVVKFWNQPLNGGDGNKNYFTYNIDITDQYFNYTSS